MREGRRGWLLPALLVPVALLSHLGPAVPTDTYYFRDFSLSFYPLREFQAAELAAGRWPGWNPYIHQGTFALPALYPIDWLHVVWSGPVAVSWLLTLHFPLAALAAYWLARELGARRPGAFVTGAVYALGGVAVSTLNLYVFLQALAWAPFVAGGLRRAARDGGRAIPVAAAAVAVAISTLAVEFVAQAVGLGVALGLAALPRPRAALRLCAALVVGVGLAAVPVAVTLGALAESVRAEGFAGSALDHSVPAVSLVQAVLPELFGSLADSFALWWGGRLFTDGFPYLMSLYLGAVGLALAAAGLAGLEMRTRLVLVGLGGLGLWYALGEAGGLASAVAGWPVLRWFRYPCKALLLPHLVAAIAAGHGLDRLHGGRGWRVFGWALSGVMALIVGVAGVVLGAPDALARELALDVGTAARMRSTVLGDCGTSLAVVGLGVLLCVAVRSGRLPVPRAAALAGLVAVADLARAGAGLNPQAPAGFYRLLPGLQALRLHELDGGRVFSFGAYRSPAVHAVLARRAPGTGILAFFANRQVLDPDNNVLDRVETAQSRDRTSFVRFAPLLPREAYTPEALPGILPALRHGAVSRVLSLDPLQHPELLPLARVPVGAGLAVHAYAVAGPWPRVYVACRVVTPGRADAAVAHVLSASFDPARDVVLETATAAGCQSGRVVVREWLPSRVAYDVEADGPGLLVTRDTHASGWSAVVDGHPAPVLPANHSQRAVPVPGGRHRVVLTYRPPGLRAGVFVLGAALVAWSLLVLRPSLREGVVRNDGV